jgi:hypothetical protein
MHVRPPRIQQRRTPGWRKPEGALSVARPSKWCNPFRVEILGNVASHAAAVERFRAYLWEHPELVAAARVALRGQPLMCWCAAGLPCHADVWIEVVNA